MFKFSNHGDRFREIREPVFSDGSLSVEVVGKEDLYDYIQSFADSCDIQKLVNRALNGEPELLNQSVGSYGDFTEFPKTYAEALQKIIDAQNLFEKLPMENRSIFGNDVFKFIAGMDDPDWMTKAGFVKTKVKDSDGRE